MSVDYPGFTGHGFDETDQSPEIEVDDWSRDIVTRVYSGPRPNLADFLETLADSNQDDEFSALRLHRRKVRVSHNGPYSEVRVPFVGIIDNKIRSPKLKAGLVERNVTLTSNAGSISLTYMAPFVTAMYSTTRRPKKARYKGAVLKLEGAFKIIDADGTVNPNIFPGSNIAQGSSDNSFQELPPEEAEDFSFRIEVFQTQFDQEQDGETWIISETNEARIVDALRSLPDFGGADIVRDR